MANTHRLTIDGWALNEAQCINLAQASCNRTGDPAGIYTDDDDIWAFSHECPDDENVDLGTLRMIAVVDPESADGV